MPGEAALESQRQGSAPTETTAAATGSHDACSRSSKNGDCKQTLKDSQLHMHLRAKLYFHKHYRNDSENLVMGPAWKPERRQQRPRHPPDSSPSCKPLAPPKLQVHPWSGGALPPGALTPRLRHIQSQTPTRISMGMWPEVSVTRQLR